MANRPAQFSLPPQSLEALKMLIDRYGVSGSAVIIASLRLAQRAAEMGEPLVVEYSPRRGNMPMPLREDEGDDPPPSAEITKVVSRG